jgi:hypothetical protein
MVIPFSFQGQIGRLPYALWSLGLFFSQHLATFASFRARGVPLQPDLEFYITPFRSLVTHGRVSDLMLILALAYLLIAAWALTALIPPGRECRHQRMDCCRRDCAKRTDSRDSAAVLGTDARSGGLFASQRSPGSIRHRAKHGGAWCPYGYRVDLGGGCDRSARFRLLWLWHVSRFAARYWRYNGLFGQSCRGYWCFADVDAGRERGVAGRRCAPCNCTGRDGLHPDGGADRDCRRNDRWRIGTYDCGIYATPAPSDAFGLCIAAPGVCDRERRLRRQASKPPKPSQFTPRPKGYGNPS